MRTTLLGEPVVNFGRTPARAAPNDGGPRLAATLRVWRQRRRERRQLLALVRLGNRMLGDIGLSRGEAEFLINKPFWRE